MNSRVALSQIEAGSDHSRMLLQGHVSRYFRETTVHGFRYVVDGRNACERLFWISFILAGYAFAALFMAQAWQDFQNHPILTTTNTISVENVPFPAVTVDAGDILNPWGFTERVLGLVEDPDHYACTADLENCNTYKDWYARFPFLKESLIDLYK